jgi:hypothetical protein
VLVAMVTNSSKAIVSIGTARCCKGKAIHNRELVSLWKRSQSVSGIGVSLCQCVSESSSVSVWKQKRTVLEESLRSEQSVISKSCSN